jgi:hypothetical protein
MLKSEMIIEDPSNLIEAFPPATICSWRNSHHVVNHSPNGAAQLCENANLKLITDKLDHKKQEFITYTNQNRTMDEGTRYGNTGQRAGKMIAVAPAFLGLGGRLGEKRAR